MSTNKTQNLNLHAWQPTDRFLRAELNENFSLLDAATPRVVAGSFAGTGSGAQTVDLGFAPTAVLVMGQDGSTWYANNNRVYGGLAVKDSPVLRSTTTAVEVTASGFAVYSGSDLYANSGVKNYLAFRL